MRIDRYLSNVLGKSRREVNSLITKKSVKVNNLVITNKDYKINEKTDSIYLDDEEVKGEMFIYLMFNKPKGLVCATTDNLTQTVVDYINYPRPIFPVGRLDKDSEGLLLLTNNGVFSHRLTSPKYNIPKTYYVQTTEEITANYVQAFAQGINLYDHDKSPYQSLPAQIQIISPNQAYVTICEGRYHQVKKMFQALNNQVLYLKRISFASLVLTEELPLGAYRALTQDELVILGKLIDMELRQ